MCAPGEESPRLVYRIEEQLGYPILLYPASANTRVGGVYVYAAHISSASPLVVPRPPLGAGLRPNASWGTRRPRISCSEPLYILGGDLGKGDQPVAGGRDPRKTFRVGAYRAPNFRPQRLLARCLPSLLYIFQGRGGTPHTSSGAAECVTFVLLMAVTTIYSYWEISMQESGGPRWLCSAICFKGMETETEGSGR
ncbi:hypothetical protein C8R44DRAFT_197739 [Mycena epipterygia]|nr:hypothetical protein C8R44DRAFT_197739 [Mycena epipterygia]